MPDAGDDSDLVETVDAASLKKPGFVMIKGQPCKIAELNQKPKATVKGNDRLHVVGFHVFTGKKYEDTLNLTAGFSSQVKVPLSTRDEYVILDVDERAGTVSALTAAGDVKDDLDLPKNPQGEPDETAQKLMEKFNSGDETKIVVLSIMGKDLILEVI